MCTLLVDVAFSNLVPVIGDLSHEGDEAFFVNLSNATGVGIADAQAVGTIVGDDPVLSIDDVSLTETHSGNPSMEFTVSISQDPVDTVTVDFATDDDTATQGVDYLPASGTLTFEPGGPLQQTIEQIVAVGKVALARYAKLQHRLVAKRSGKDKNSPNVFRQRMPNGVNLGAGFDALGGHALVPVELQLNLRPVLVRPGAHALQAGKGGQRFFDRSRDLSLNLLGRGSFVGNFDVNPRPLDIRKFLKRQES